MHSSQRHLAALHTDADSMCGLVELLLNLLLLKLLLVAVQHLLGGGLGAEYICVLT